MLVGLQAHPRRRLRGRPDRRRVAAGRPSAHITLPLLRPTLALTHGAVRHRVAARVRAVLHPHQGRPGQQHDHRGAARSTRSRSRARTTSASPPPSRCIVLVALVLVNVAAAPRVPPSGGELSHADLDAPRRRRPRRVRAGSAPTTTARRHRPAHPVLGVHRRARRDLPVPAGLDGASRRCRRTRAPARSTAGASATTVTLGELPGRDLACTWRTRRSSRCSPWRSRSVISLLGGYAFARFSFPGKNLLFLATLAILMVPYATLLIPLYVLLNAGRAAELAGRASRWCSRCSSCRSRRS